MACTRCETIPASDSVAWSFDVASGESDRVRLDVCMADEARRRGLGWSRAQISRLISAGHVLIDAKSAKSAQRLRPGQHVCVAMPVAAPLTHVAPIPMALDILFEDDHLLVLNKAAHLPVHPGAGAHRPTLVHGLLAHQAHWSGIGGVQRPGIVHRLDADTTGAIVIAKNDHSHRALAEQFAQRRVRKQYVALCTGPVPKHVLPHGTIDTWFGRHPTHRQRFTGRLAHGQRRARTSYRVIETHDGRALVQLRLWTGRTHQARVHLMELGLPVMGDALYGSARGLSAARALGVSHHALHAHQLAFCHPKTLQSLSFRAPLPASWAPLSPLAARLSV